VRAPKNGAPGATLQTPSYRPLRLGLQRRYPIFDRAIAKSTVFWLGVILI